jgi:hypothetical protein
MHDLLFSPQLVLKAMRDGKKKCTKKLLQINKMLINLAFTETFPTASNAAVLNDNNFTGQKLKTVLFHHGSLDNLPALMLRKQ